MKLKSIGFIALPFLFVSLAGCKAYEPAETIDWTRESGTNEMSVALRSPDDAASLALVGNLRLNMQRLKAAGAANIAKETGWWEDPELDFDILRIIESSENPFLGGANVKFTIPLSGAPKAARKAAEAFHAAELQRIKAAEKIVSAEAKRIALALCFNRKKIDMLEAYKKDADILLAVSSAEKLHQAGEYTLVDFNGIKRQEHAREHERMELEDEREELENAFRSLAGLHPETKIRIMFAPPAPPAAKPAAPDILSLAGHVEVKAALADLECSEAELKTEILKQYPELKIGPLAGNEEGKDRIGVVAGITLPLWNRNRKAIAEAESARDEARLGAVDTWKNLAMEAYAVHARLVKLLNHPPPPAGEAEYAKKLFSAGELSPLDYLAAREAILTVDLENVSWESAVAAANAELEKYVPENP